ncbi:hypothetical protein SOASR030_10330 [Leminorella grimontii]|uniref:Uncharacterized protein n=2 Tax=Leminorella grimontii TaxID=82981 RepID=A0AAV5MYJ4_9GAMM|nr:hypothetical protein SOASR030_10330 [Leminorella grimontii]GKX61272.1 hypothetical protein SOASR031_35870 [Leminorella grimontii]
MQMDISDFLLQARRLNPDAKVMLTLEPNAGSVSVEWGWEKEGRERYFKHRMLLKELQFDEAITAFFSSCVIGMENAANR